MKCKFIFLLLICLVEFVNSERILVLTFFCSKSHKLTYMPLLEELAARGHEITLVSPIKPTKEVKGIKEIFTYDTDASKMFDMFDMKEKGIRLNPMMLITSLNDVCRKSYELPQVMDLLNQEFDLIFMQTLFNDCALGIAYRLKAPLVLFSPASVEGKTAGTLGTHLPPSFVVNVMLDYSDEMDFKERMINFGLGVLFHAFTKFYYDPFMSGIYQEKLGQDIPNVREILANASLLLSNGHFSLAKPKPLLPDIVDVGGLHSRPAKPLPKDLEDFISKGGKNGFILFSMGSAIKGDTMSDAKRQIFLNVFSKLKQQILWKWESETMPNLPPNVKLSKWLPQQDLLGHSSIKLFMTHCGGGSTEEAIYHAVPIIGIPIFGDQNLNAQQAKDRGYSLTVQWNEITEESLSTSINEIITNPKYGENVQKLSKIFKDKPIDPLQLGAYWVEYVMRHKGAPHLRSAGRKLNYLQYHSYDVIVTYFVILITILYLLFAILRFIIRKICNCFKSSKDTDKVKKQKLKVH